MASQARGTRRAGAGTRRGAREASERNKGGVRSGLRHGKCGKEAAGSSAATAGSSARARSQRHGCTSSWHEARTRMPLVARGEHAKKGQHAVSAWTCSAAAAVRRRRGARRQQRARQKPAAWLHKLAARGAKARAARRARRAREKRAKRGECIDLQRGCCGAEAAGRAAAACQPRRKPAARLHKLAARGAKARAARRARRARRKGTPRVVRSGGPAAWEMREGAAGS